MASEHTTTGLTTGPRLYRGWRRERIGWAGGLTGWQLLAVTAVGVPLLMAVGRARWALAAQLLPVCVATVVLVAVPVRGRPAFRWLGDLMLWWWGRTVDWSRWRSEAATGTATPEQLQELDLPGVLAGLRMYDGPPYGPGLVRVCVVHDPRSGRWAATARCEHPGLGAADEAARAGYADALGGLLHTQAQGEEPLWISILVRATPADGAERAAWVADHAEPDTPEIVRRSTAIAEAQIRAAAIRHETYVTVAIGESARLRRTAADAGGGPDGRARVLYRHLADIEARLRGLGATRVAWLDSEQLAEAIRTGYCPADARLLEAARQEAARGRPTVTGIPAGAAGPVNAPPPPARSYQHDAYTTVSYTILLPDQGTRVGSLAQMLTPPVAGERRTLALHYQPLSPARSHRQVEHDVWIAETRQETKVRKGFRLSRQDRRQTAETAAHEQQVALGHTMVRVAGAAAVTVPTGWPVEDHAAAFEAAARAGGYRLLRLDLAEDTGFVAGVLPLGIGLPDRTQR